MNTLTKKKVGILVGTGVLGVLLVASTAQARNIERNRVRSVVSQNGITIVFVDTGDFDRHRWDRDRTRYRIRKSRHHQFSRRNCSCCNHRNFRRLRHRNWGRRHHRHHRRTSGLRFHWIWR